jgi:hypothetical protein
MSLSNVNVTELPQDGVVIRVADQVLTQGSLINNLTSINPSLKLFLGQVLHCARVAEHLCPNGVVVSRHAVKQAYGAIKKIPSDSLIARRLNELCELGVCSYRTLTNQGPLLRQNVYFLDDLAPLVSKPALALYDKPNEPKKRRTKNMIQIQKELFDKNDQLIMLQNPSEIAVHIHDGIFNGIIDAAQRLSPKDSRSRFIQAELLVAGYPLTVTSSCSSAEGSEISVLSDQRAQRCIMNYCQKEILQRKAVLIHQHGEENFHHSMIPNFFVLDVHDLAGLMGMKISEPNIDAIVAMMRRLADTTFRVNASANPWFRQNFSLFNIHQTQADTYEFRFLHNMDIAHDKTNTPDMFDSPHYSGKPRFYSFSLDMRTFLQLLGNRSTIFLSHPELVKQRSGIIHRFSNWARAFVGSRDKPGVSAKWYTLRDLHTKLTPAARFDNFKTYFLRALEQFCLEEYQPGKPAKYLVYGYYVYRDVKNGEHEFRFARDPEDPYVGDNSRHNVLVRQNYLDDLQLLEQHLPLFEGKAGGGR